MKWHMGLVQAQGLGRKKVMAQKPLVSDEESLVTLGCGFTLEAV